MKRYFCISLLLILFVTDGLQGQSQGFIVKPAPFSTWTNDEFSPVFYKGGIVFCTNQNYNSLVAYKDDQDRLFKIFYAEKKDTLKWKSPKLFSEEITSDFNDGPVTFDENRNMIFYTRNNSIHNSLRDISDTLNKLGIYSAELIEGIWTNIKPFTYNNPLYSFCTPSIAPDGSRIYFSSDMPGGSGGMDLYYCDQSSNEWEKPVNLGPAINTQKNESFPFAGMYAKLFFSSDGHEGLGGKDLFYTQEINGKWITPVHLDSTINSSSDDFGIISDSTFTFGYFSSNRRNTDDIFSFSMAPVEFINCDTIKENKYCFTFYDEQHEAIDTIPVTYQWDFGDGIIRIGKEVQHCFPGPGEYSVRLNITDDLTGDTIAKQVPYHVELENIDEAYINSVNVGLADKPVSFKGLTNSLKGFSVTDYFWNFGDGFNPGGPSMNMTFRKKGEYTVQLGLLGEKDSLDEIPKKCVMKKIRIYNNWQEFALKNTGEGDEVTLETDSVAAQKQILHISICFMDDLSERQKVKIGGTLEESEKKSISFDRYGTDPASLPFLENVASVLKQNPDIRLELVLHTIENEMSVGKIGISEIWAQELAFYFKNKGIDKDLVRSKGFGFSKPVFKPYITDNKTIDGVVEFIFMKN